MLNDSDHEIDDHNQNDEISLSSDDDEEIEDEHHETSHQVRSILEVKFPPGSISKIINGDDNSDEENLFLVDW